MKRLMTAFLMVFCLSSFPLGLTSCGNGSSDQGEVVMKPADIEKLCYDTGMAAALAYVAAAKPSPDQIAGVKVVVDLINQNIKGWIEGGFIFGPAGD